MNNITLSLLTLLTLSHILLAEDIAVTDVEAKYTNKGKVEIKESDAQLRQSLNFGLSNTTGNTKTLNLNGKYDFSVTTNGYNNTPLKVAFDTSAFFTENNDVKSNEEFIANLGLEQMLDENWLAYTGLSWLRNPDFRNYNNKVALGVGAGRELYNDGKYLLVGKIGTAYNIEDYANTQATKKFASLNEYIEYSDKLNKVSQLYLKVGSMQNLENFKDDYELLAVLGVNFTVGENINLSIEEEVAYDHLPPVGFKTTDTKSIVRLGYNF